MATDDEIQELRSRHLYNAKQADEPVTVGRLRIMRDDFGGGVASVGERYLGNGRWGYCRDKRRCQAEQTIFERKRREQQQGTPVTANRAGTP